MGAVTNNILTVTEPTIKLEKFDITNTETADGPDKNNDRASKFIGDQFPGIRINKFDFNREDIVSFTLELNSMFPILSAVLRDSKGVFTKGQYPQDGDIVSIYIRSKDESLYKPIRIDFDITEISVSPAANAEQYSGPSGGGPVQLSLQGVIRLPGLFAEICKSYPEDTSYNFMINLAEELQLGFASNEDFTDDSMKRICPFDTRLKLLKDSSESAYKDDFSFFKAYIDSYYYLNLVNINKQIKFGVEIEDTMNSLIQDSSISKTVQDGSDNAIEDKLYLTNHQIKKGTALYMKKYAVVNNSASVTLGDGYRRIIQYYDTADKEYRNFTIEPLTTDNLPPDQAPLKGKYDSEGKKMYKEQQKYKYVGKQGKNVHVNYYYAQMLNYKNSLELEKLYLDVELETANLALYRYQILPIVVYEQSRMISEVQEQKEIKAQNNGTEMKDKIGEKGDAKDGQIYHKIDEKLTGVYIIGRIVYTYNEIEGRLKQKISLFRREWPNVP
jgi:hypothetical protein